MIIAFLLFLEINDRRQNDTISQVQKNFTIIIDITAKMISSGYLQWDELYNAYINNDSEFIDGCFNDIMNMSPYISEIRIQEIDPEISSKAFKIRNIDNNIFIDFNIFTSPYTKKIDDEIVRIKINKEKILSDVEVKQLLSFKERKYSFPFAYGLVLKSNNPPIRFYQVISSICIGLLSALIMIKTFNKHSNYFYETRGLEKIIFLFEKTERYSANHSKYVSTIAYIIGKKYGFKGKKLKDLKVAALLHDIGKISIPREILNKQEYLNSKELELIMEHPRLSDNIIKSFEELSHLRPYIKHHHEKMDGSGYPSGLKGEKIPIQSRIISVADIFEALTGERPYRSPMKPKAAVTFMKAMSLDKNVFKILEENLDEICLKIDRDC